jgi:ferredoxin
MNEYIITNEQINQLASELLNQHWNVVAESSDGISFKSITPGEDIKLNPSSKPSNLSPKQFFFPKSETLFFYKKTQTDVEIIDTAGIGNKTVIFGVKPCDTALTGILSKVFNWDYKDEFFNKKVENTVLIGLKCGYNDDDCFCTSVGLSPESEKGSDIFLVPLEDGSFLAKAVTEKGSEFVKENSKFFSPATDAKSKPVEMKAAPQKKFDPARIKEWLDHNFENEYWKGLGDLCLGCAQCAYVCPTCHCFDIVDENFDYSSGRRVKNWDCCQYTMFTKHASGHNPRSHQSDRYRQRVFHKFKYYPDRFETILCTGCGRCIRGCGIGMNISEVLQQIDKF